MLILPNKQFIDASNSSLMCGKFVPKIKGSRIDDGFTLVELLVVVAIIGILTAYALPSYRDSVIRAKIPDATSELATRRVQMEQYFQDNHTYIGAPACVAASGSQYFNFGCTATAINTYTLQATGIGSMAGFSYTIDQDNARTSTIVGPAKSSFIGTSPNCWIIRTGGSCS